MTVERRPLFLTIQQNSAVQLPLTASAVGIDFNTSRNLYYNTSSQAWVSQEYFSGSSASLGNITGSNLLLIGNPGRITNQVGPLIISSSVGITTTGSLIFSGSRSSTGNEQSSVLVNGDIFVSGGVGTNDYIQLKNVDARSLPTNTTAAYFYTSGSTNDLYFTQFSGSLANTTRLRWLEGNLATGLLYGGILSTTNGSTTFNVASGQGVIVDYNASTTSDPYPTIAAVSWPLSSSIPLYFSGSAQITYIGIDANGSVVQRVTPFSGIDDQSNINLGRILHQTNAVTNGTITSPIVAYGNPTWNSEINRAFGPMKISGHVLAPSGSGTTLGLTKSAGDSIAEGRNYTTNPDQPNYILGSLEGAQLNSKIFRIYTNTSGTPVILNNGGPGFTAIDPGTYNPGNLGVTASVGSGKFTIQRVFWFPNSVNQAFFVYYGTTEYATLAAAESAITTDTFFEGNNTVGSAIFVAYILVAYNASNLNNSAQARIIQAGLFRNAGLGAGGGGGSSSPGGSDTNVQFNNAGAFSGDADFTFSAATNTLSVANIQVAGIVGASGSVTLGDASSDVVTVTGQLTASQGLSSSNSISAAGNLFVQGTSFHTGAAYFGNIVSASSGFQAGASSTMKALLVSGSVTVSQSVSASGNISTAGNLLVQGTSQHTGSAYFASDLQVLGNATVSGTLNRITNDLSTSDGWTLTNGSGTAAITSGVARLTMPTSTNSGDGGRVSVVRDLKAASYIKPERFSALCRLAALTNGDSNTQIGFFVNTSTGAVNELRIVAQPSGTVFVGYLGGAFTTLATSATTLAWDGTWWLQVMIVGTRAFVRFGQGTTTTPPPDADTTWRIVWSGELFANMQYGRPWDRIGFYLTTYGTGGGAITVDLDDFIIETA